MLDAYIIDAIRREEMEREREFERRRVYLELPVRYPEKPRRESPDIDGDQDRGSLIIPLNPEPEVEEDAA